MRKILPLLLFLLPLFASAQQLIAHRGCIKDGYDFWLYVPEDYDPNEYSKPLILFLHGRTLCGDDLNIVRNYGCINAVERGVGIDALIVAPQAQGAWNPQSVFTVAPPHMAIAAATSFG